jgi:hypothetical protein
MILEAEIRDKDGNHIMDLTGINEAVFSVYQEPIEFLRIHREYYATENLTKQGQPRQQWRWKVCGAF